MLNAFLMSGIKQLFRTLVRKYAEGKGPVTDSVCRSTTWSRDLLLPLLDSRWDREQSCLLWLCLKLTDFRALNFNFEKLNSFFFFWLLAMKAQGVIIQLRKVEFPFLLHSKGKRTCLM